MNEAKISEIFQSYQGEGPYVGVKQVFVRFYGCSFGCAFCDTKPKSFESYTKEALIKKIASFKGEYHSVSLTGGEPLEQTEFLKTFLPSFKREINKPVYLETNGIMHKELSEVINFVDIVAMDIKLPSATLKRPLWEEHKKFLEISKAKDVFVKIIITEKTGMSDIFKAKDVIKQVDPKIRVVLQPVDPIDNIREPSRNYIGDMRRRLSNELFNVKIVPQFHKAAGIK